MSKKKLAWVKVLNTKFNMEHGLDKLIGKILSTELTKSGFIFDYENYIPKVGERFYGTIWDIEGEITTSGHLINARKIHLKKSTIYADKLMGDFIEVYDYHFNQMVYCKVLSKVYKGENGPEVDVLFAGPDHKTSVLWNPKENQWEIQDGDCSFITIKPIKTNKNGNVKKASKSPNRTDSGSTKGSTKKGSKGSKNPQ